MSASIGVYKSGSFTEGNSEKAVIEKALVFLLLSVCDHEEIRDSHVLFCGHSDFVLTIIHIYRLGDYPANRHSCQNESLTSRYGV